MCNVENVDRAGLSSLRFASVVQLIERLIPGINTATIL